jgi:hypothetical protein
MNLEAQVYKNYFDKNLLEFFAKFDEYMAIKEETINQKYLKIKGKISKILDLLSKN